MITLLDLSIFLLLIIKLTDLMRALVSFLVSVTIYNHSLTLSTKKLNFFKKSSKLWFAQSSPENCLFTVEFLMNLMFGTTIMQ
jgi:hypothetical protein